MNTESPTPRTGWRKSSFSTGTGSCVEVAPASDGVAVRHSKHPAAGTITFSHPAWTAFVRDARDARHDLTATNAVATITRIGTDTLVTSLTTEVELRFDQGEWAAFLAGAADGEFDFADQFAA